jgi:DNA-binding XRE family transcriptional regulator
MNWSDQIKRYRFQRGLTQEQLADEWGVAVRSIRRYEAGEAIPATWLESIKKTLRPVDVRQLDALGAYKVLVETNALPCTLYDANLYLVAASKPALALWVQPPGRQLIGQHMGEAASPEAVNALARLGGVNVLMADKAIVSGSVRQRFTDLPVPEFYTNARFYVVRDVVGLVQCVLIFSDVVTKAQHDALPAGIQLH